MAMNIHSFRQTRIEGTIRVNQNAIVVFQTPFDAGWRAISDGRPTPTLKVDSGLLGVALKNGEHRIELRYQPPLLYAGAVVSILSCISRSFIQPLEVATDSLIQLNMLGAVRRKEQLLILLLSAVAAVRVFIFAAGIPVLQQRR